MLDINDNRIKMTRGDTARFIIDITNSVNDSLYEISPDDELTLTVKKTINDNDFLIQKKIIGDNQFYIKPEDTAQLPYGQYKYDVQLTTVSGDVYTIIPPSTFKLDNEVTF